MDPPSIYYLYRRFLAFLLSSTLESPVNDHPWPVLHHCRTSALVLAVAQSAAGFEMDWALASSASTINTRLEGLRYVIAKS